MEMSASFFSIFLFLPVPLKLVGLFLGGIFFWFKTDLNQIQHRQLPQDKEVAELQIEVPMFKAAHIENDLLKDDGKKQLSANARVRQNQAIPDRGDALIGHQKILK
ncbi:MAG: hypothetical protein AB8F34_11870 [Akkermansiaceae bacterium]